MRGARAIFEPRTLRRYSAVMTAEDVFQEIDRQPFVPLRLHLASGQKIDVPYADTAWIRQNTLLIVHPLHSGTHAIGRYDVIALRLIERIEQRNGNSRAKHRRRSD
jgi:hypothetical protein